MKQVIVLCASVILGLFIVNCLIGTNGSVFSSMKSLWTEEVKIRDMENWQ